MAIQCSARLLACVAVAGTLLCGVQAQAAGPREAAPVQQQAQKPAHHDAKGGKGAGHDAQHAGGDRHEESGDRDGPRDHPPVVTPPVIRPPVTRPPVHPQPPPPVIVVPPCKRGGPGITRC
ncbi:hypothetical protein [Sphaerotilus sp.]|uniref:hypothetical protein n=1 Tax=Sphaerotilus sp. TaxID=2093942 RepID=UPI0025F25CC9|nr:hypothetical protein [Sphaerotilus sp.]